MSPRQRLLTVLPGTRTACSLSGGGAAADGSCLSGTGVPLDPARGLAGTHALTRPASLHTDHCWWSVEPSPSHSPACRPLTAPSPSWDIGLASSLAARARPVPSFSLGRGAPSLVGMSGSCFQGTRAKADVAGRCLGDLLVGRGNTHGPGSQLGWLRSCCRLEPVQGSYWTLNHGINISQSKDVSMSNFLF